MERWNASTLTMPTGDGERTITRNSDVQYIADWAVSEPEKSAFMDGDSSTIENPFYLEFPESWFQPDFSDSFKVRIVECLEPGIYRVKWVTTSSTDGLSGHSVKEPAQ